MFFYFEYWGLEGGNVEFLIKVFVSVLGFTIGDYVSVFGTDIPLVNKGNGLYKLEDGFYAYRGLHPDNYIYFNNELWRIMSFNDNFVKIVKNESLGDMAFDVDGSNVWEESSLKEYLKSYYDKIDSKYKSFVYGGIEVMNIDDYLMSNSNFEFCGSLNLYFKNDERCFKTSYINDIVKGSKNGAAWTLTKDEDTVFYVGNTYFNDIRSSDSNFGVLPVLSLDRNIELYGKGTLQYPYKIKN